MFSGSACGSKTSSTPEWATVAQNGSIRMPPPTIATRRTSGSLTRARASTMTAPTP